MSLFISFPPSLPPSAHPPRSLAFDPSGHVIAAGLAGGAITLFLLFFSVTPPSATSFQRASDSTGELIIMELETRKDCIEEISDLKFSPNGRMLAVGSHDNFIDVYSCKLNEMADVSATAAAAAAAAARSTQTALVSAPYTLALRYLKRLRGHTSYVTHLDWSGDNRLLQSTCGSYELLYWDVQSGKQLPQSRDHLEADCPWASETCTIGFPVMGIWLPNAKGTDINCVDVRKQQQQQAGTGSHSIVATGDDFGHLSLFNYPCVVKKAPRKSYQGHSSHIMGIKFIPSATKPSPSSSSPSSSYSSYSSSSQAPSSKIVTVGGNDCAAIVWKTYPDPVRAFPVKGVKGGRNYGR